MICVYTTICRAPVASHFTHKFFWICILQSPLPTPSTVVASAVLDTSASSTEPACEKDSTFHGSTCSHVDSSFSDESITGEQISSWSERKWIVNESALLKLFTTCHTCGQFIDTSEKEILTSGSKIKIKWTCIGGHRGVWESCPDVRGLAENNLVSSAAILFTGTTQTEITEWADLLNLQLPRKTQYYSMQSTYLIPVVYEAYNEMQEENMSNLREITSKGGHIDIGGDGR